MFRVIPTARSSQERGQEGPQLLNTVPGTCEQGATENTLITSKHWHRINWNVKKTQYVDHTYSQPLFILHTTHKHTWTVVSVTAHDLRSQPLTVAPLPLWTGTVTLSPPGSNPATAWLGTVRPVTPLTPATVTWKRPKLHGEIVKKSPTEWKLF